MGWDEGRAPSAQGLQPLQQRRRLPVPQPDTGLVARGMDLGGGSTLPEPGRIRAGSVLASLPLHQLCLPLPCCLPVGFGRSPLSQTVGKSLPSCLHFQFCDTVKLISRAVKLLPVGSSAHIRNCLDHKTPWQEVCSLRNQLMLGVY